MSNPSVSLGVANKDMSDSYCGGPCMPCSTSDDADKKKEWEDTICFPSFSVDGKQAELMGCDDCKVGDLIEVTLRLKVSGKRDNSKLVDGKAKRDISITFDILKTSNLTDVGEDNDGDTEADKGSSMDSSEDSSPVRALVGMDDGY